MKTKITLKQMLPDSDRYLVVSLTNRFEPKVGSDVSAADVQEMLLHDEELTVTVKKAS